MSDVDVIPRFELMIFEGAEDFVISVDKCPKVGRGHDRGLLSEARVLILIGCCSKSASKSGAWRSLELTHKSWVGE